MWRRDEMWAGEWRLVELRRSWVGTVVVRLAEALLPRVDELGLFGAFSGGIFAADDDWRVPDLFATRPEYEYGDGDGWARAELVVEIRSPGDDSYLKLPFYAERVREVLILHRDRTPELYRGMDRAAPDPDGAVHSEALGGGLRSGGDRGRAAPADHMARGVGGGLT